MPRSVLAGLVVILEVLAGYQMCTSSTHARAQLSQADTATAIFRARPHSDIPTIPTTLRYFGFYGVMIGGEESFAFSNFVFDWPANINTTILNHDAGPAL